MEYRLILRSAINTHDRAFVDATMKKSEHSYRDKEIICHERFEFRSDMYNKVTRSE
jgi:hypothetical protein